MKMALFCTKFRHRLDKESNEYKWISSFDIGSEPSAYSCSHLQKDAEDVNPMNICQRSLCITIFYAQIVMEVVFVIV
jgi:hypothetical protein